MTARQFVENGADEIQHANMLMLNFLFDKVQDTRTPARFTSIGEYGASIVWVLRPCAISSRCSRNSTIR